LERDLNEADYTLDECRDAYNPVIEELLAQPDADTRIGINVVRDGNNGNSYYDVYVVDELTYPGERLSLGGIVWRDISAARLLDAAGLDQLNQIAYILWELTYDGWTEKEQAEFHQKLKEMVFKPGYTEGEKDE
jgi:hypothetical protein